MFLNGLLYNKISKGYSCTDKYYCALADEAQKATRKIFNLTKEDDVCHYVDKKPLNKERKDPRTKAPKIQLLLCYISYSSHADILL